MMRTNIAAFCLLITTACGADAGRDAVDIEFTEPAPPSEAMAAALAEFREGIPETHALETSASSRDVLVQRFTTALEKADTSAFAAMMMSQAEFAWLYYPSTKHTRPPYEMEAELLWFFILQNAEKGIGRALRQYGGSRYGYEGYRCAAEPEIEGQNRLWQGCMVRIGTNQGFVEKRLFGTIIERDGRFKFVSFANDL